MCGIVGYIGNEDCKTMILDGLKTLEYRGYDSAGVAFFDRREIRVIRAVGKLSELGKRTHDVQNFGTCAIGHTRWATHGSVTETNAHPHSTPDLTIVHNGIIENHSGLKLRLEKKNYTCKSETDSEIIGLLIQSHIDDGIEPFDAFCQSIREITGSFAIVMMNRLDPGTLFVARKNSPLVIGQTPEAVMVASDIPALIHHTKQFVFLDDNVVGRITASSIALHDASTQRLTPFTVQTLDFAALSTSKHGYDHYMKKEIFEQPDAVIRTLEGRFLPPDTSVHLHGFPLDAKSVQDVERIIIVGCGSAFHAGMVGKHVLEKLTRIPVELDIASELRYRDPIINARTLVIAVSQSGETADTLAAIKYAKSYAMMTMAITNAPHSSITREVDYVLNTHAGFEIGVAATKTFMTQMLMFYLLAFKLSQLQNPVAELPEKSLQILKEVSTLLEKINAVLKQDAAISKIAQNHAYARNFLFLGRGNQHPIALEGALKLKEISYMEAHGYPAGEIKHGPIALIGTDSTCVVIANQTPLYDKLLSTIHEIKARGGRVIAITNDPAPLLSASVDDIIAIPECSEWLSPFLTIVPLQLLAYHMAVLKGTDVDQPRNLAKSVTVE